MNKVNTDIAPSWFPSETPEERVYWRSGVDFTPERLANWKALQDKSLLYWTDEETAWIVRVKALSHPYYVAVTPRPVPVTRDEATQRAIEQGADSVKVLDEHGNIVEEWTV